MTSFIIGAGFGVVGIACLFMVVVWAKVAIDGSVVEDPRFRIVASSMAMSSLFLAGLCINRVCEQLLGYTLPLSVVYTCLFGMGVAKAVTMSSSAIDGDRRMVSYFVVTSLVWVAFCAWGVFG